MTASRPVFLGIDLGSSGITAFVHDGRSGCRLTDPLGGTPIPAVVYPDDAGDVLVGGTALEPFLSDPTAQEPDLKRRLTATDDVAVGHHRRSRPMLLTRLLCLVRAQATTAPAGVALIAPGSYDEYAQKLLAECAADAGLAGEMIDERVAALLAAGDDGLPPAARILVCDLGAAATRVADVRLRDGVHRVAETLELADVSGDRFDLILLDWIRDLAPSYGKGLPERLVLAACRRLKHTLSFVPAVPVPSWLTAERVVLTADEWDDRIRVSMAAVSRACRELADGEQVPLVVVGGGARLRSLPEGAFVPADPASAAARGGARWIAGIRSNPGPMSHGPSGGSPFRRTAE